MFLFQNIDGCKTCLSCFGIEPCLSKYTFFKLLNKTVINENPYQFVTCTFQLVFSEMFKLIKTVTKVSIPSENLKNLILLESTVILV